MGEKIIMPPSEEAIRRVNKQLSELAQMEPGNHTPFGDGELLRVPGGWVYTIFREKPITQDSELTSEPVVEPVACCFVPIPLPGMPA